jgi:hypothetical protein
MSEGRTVLLAIDETAVRRAGSIADLLRASPLTTSVVRAATVLGLNALERVVSQCSPEELASITLDQLVTTARAEATRE